jgi:hypothetical protein
MTLTTESHLCHAIYTAPMTSNASNQMYGKTAVKMQERNQEKKWKYDEVKTRTKEEKSSWRKTSS